jgi:hypothetical protein
MAHFRAALDQFENTLTQGDTAALQQLIEQAPMCAPLGRCNRQRLQQSF